MGPTRRQRLPDRSAQKLRAKFACSLIIAPAIPTGITAATSRAISTAAASARFLRTRFVHLKLPAVHVEPVELTDGLGCVATIAQFDKAEASRAPRFPVSDYSGGGHLIALLNEQLLQGFVVHAE